MDANLEIGDIVLCVDSNIKSGMESFVSEAFLNWIKEGKEYTVRGFADNDGIVTGVWLEEIINFPIYQPLLGREQEPAFSTRRFIKLKSISEKIEEENELGLIKILQNCIEL